MVQAQGSSYQCLSTVTYHTHAHRRTSATINVSNSDQHCLIHRVHNFIFMVILRGIPWWSGQASGRTWGACPVTNDSSPRHTPVSQI